MNFVTEISFCSRKLVTTLSRNFVTVTSFDFSKNLVTEISFYRNFVTVVSRYWLAAAARKRGVVPILSRSRSSCYKSNGLNWSY